MTFINIYLLGFNLVFITYKYLLNKGIAMKQQLSDKDPIEIEKDIYWIGFADFEAGFSNNAYLIKARKESMLIDPGPGYPLYEIFL